MDGGKRRKRREKRGAIAFAFVAIPLSHVRTAEEGETHLPSSSSSSYNLQASLGARGGGGGRAIILQGRDRGNKGRGDVRNDTAKKRRSPSYFPPSSPEKKKS